MDGRRARALGRPPCAPTSWITSRKRIIGDMPHASRRRAVHASSSPAATSATRRRSRRSTSPRSPSRTKAAACGSSSATRTTATRNVAIEFRGRMIRRRIEAGAMLEVVLSGDPQLARRDAGRSRRRCRSMRSRRPRTATDLGRAWASCCWSAIVVGQQIGEHTIFGRDRAAGPVPELAVTPVPEDDAGPGRGDLAELEAPADRRRSPPTRRSPTRGSRRRPPPDAQAAPAPPTPRARPLHRRRRLYTPRSAAPLVRRRPSPPHRPERSALRGSRFLGQWTLWIRKSRPGPSRSSAVWRKCSRAASSWTS